MTSSTIVKSFLVGNKLSHKAEVQSVSKIRNGSNIDIESPKQIA